MANADSTGLSVALISLWVKENNGIRILAASLRRAGFRTFEIYFKDYRNNEHPEETATEKRLLFKLLSELKPDLVGFSVRASGYHDIAAGLTQEVRELLGVPVLWGGMHVISCPEESIREADLICTGEAEEAIVELAERMQNGQSTEDLSGFWFRRNDRIIRTPIRQPIADLDSLPFRDYTSPDKFIIDRNQLHRKRDPMVDLPEYQIAASRGCPFGTCSYCSNTFLRRRFEGGNVYYRLRSVEKTIEELEQALRVFRRLKIVRFDDEVFYFPRSWREQFLEFYPRRVQIPFEIHMDPRAVDEEWLYQLRTIGLVAVNLGIQNTERICRTLYNRQISNQRILQATQVLHRIGAENHYHLIFDDPESTSTDKEDLFQLLLRIPRPYELYLFSLTLYPHSDLTEKLLVEGKIQEQEMSTAYQKIFHQWRVDLSYPRAAEDRFWLSLIVLISKNFIPLSLVRRFSRSRYLRRHPVPLVAFAQTINLVKMGLIGFRMLVHGEMSWALIRQWVNPRSLITQ